VRNVSELLLQAIPKQLEQSNIEAATDAFELDHFSGLWSKHANLICLKLLNQINMDNSY
jgi:hypothetical protein